MSRAHGSSGKDGALEGTPENGAAAAAAPDAIPLSHDEFDALARDHGLTAPLAVALSGGGDSMALLLLVLDWAARVYGEPAATGRTDALKGVLGGAGAKVTALIVDHGLRAGSDREAEWVAGEAARRGADVHVLRRDGPPLRANVQAEAREARYRLMEAWCRAHRVPTLLTAHTQEDQAETVLLRLGRGSGVDGLAGMAARSMLRDETRKPTIELIRPLLGVSRARLRAVLTAAGQDWVEDPSNQDPRFARVRMRGLADALAREGLTPARLAETAARFARARAALEDARDRLMSEAVVWHEAGYALLDAWTLARAPEDVALRVLAALVQAIGGQTHPPRLDRLERMLAALGSTGLERNRTLGGCRFAVAREQGTVLVCRENRALGPDVVLRSGQTALWDSRFRVGLPADSGGGVVRPLGRQGVGLLREAMGRSPLGVPVLVRAALPALWRGARLVCVPHAGFDPEASGFRAVFLARGGGGDAEDVLEERSR